MTGTMMLGPNAEELTARARADLRMGVPVQLTNGDTNYFLFSIETMHSDRFQDLLESGRTRIALTERRASTLKVPSYGGDIAQIALPSDASLMWAKGLADPSLDMALPMKGPFRALRDAPSKPAKAAIAMLKSARLLPAAFLMEGPITSGLTSLSVEAVIPHLAMAHSMKPVAGAQVPLTVSDAGRVHVFRSDDGSEEHFAIEIGSPPRDLPVLSRLHSACFTGDLMGSLKCDCGPQLRAALETMGTRGTGVLLYLNQEGRGIGHANKMRAYALQDVGFDTVEANHRLGFEDDERDFRIGADILKRMGFSSVKLMTNNPAKIDMMQQQGIRVSERVPLIVGETSQNQAYLATKARKSGHML